MLFLKSRSSWLKRNKEISPVRGGRKRFDVHKNRESFKDVDSIRFSKTPLKSIRSERKHFRVDLSAENSSARNLSHVKLSPIDGYFQKKLKEKESEIHLLKGLYKDTNQQLLEIKKQYRVKRPIIEQFRPVEVPRMDFTPEPRLYTNMEIFKQRVLTQPKFTKSNPKIILTSPITGVSPNFSSISPTFL
jgi:hypothetical protein